MKTTIISIRSALLGSALIAGGFACATAGPSPALLSARAAYLKAEGGPAKELNPADLHDARVALDSAENAAKDDGDSPVAKSQAYLALRRAELADAQGRTSAATREKDEALKKLQALKDQSLANAKSQLAAATATQERTDEKLSQTQGQLDAEHKSRVEMHGQLAKASADQKRTDNELKQTQGKLDAEHESRVEMHGQLAEASAEQKRTDTELEQAKGQIDAEHQARLAAEQSALDALGKIAAVKQEARGTVITLSGSVLFASGKSEQLPSAHAQLAQVAQALKMGDRPILVEGHTDSRGSQAVNQPLSEQRAQSVLEYLVAHEVPRERIRAIGMGASRPAAQNDSPEGRANNRRVEIVLEPKPASN